MELELRTYKSDRKTVAKKYKVNSLDLSFGVMRDTIKALHPESLDLNDEKQVGLAILGAWGQVEPLLLDMFPGVTAAELDTVKLSNLIDIAKKAFEYMASEFNIFSADNEKN